MDYIIVVANETYSYQKTYEVIEIWADNNIELATEIGKIQKEIVLITRK